MSILDNDELFLKPPECKLTGPPLWWFANNQQALLWIITAYISVLRYQWESVNRVF